MRPGKDPNGEKPLESAHLFWEGIEGRPDVAWRDDGGDRYLYRPGRLLVDQRYEALLGLGRFGARPLCPRRKEGRRLQRLGLRLWSIDDRGTAPEVVDALRRSLGFLSPDEQVQAVSLNHVFAVAQVMKFGPGDLPVPGEDDAEVEAEVSTRSGGGTGKGVRISILDTGFVEASTQHPLLHDDYTDDGDDLDALYDEATGAISSVFGGHGTFVAGIVRQRAPHVLLDPEVTLDDIGLVDDVELALDLLGARQADIINLSLAGPSKGDAPPPALAKALTYLRDNSEAVVVAAAGNDYVLAESAGKPHVKMWPAAFGSRPGFDGHVVGVAAVDRQVEASTFSNRGTWVTACAFGVDERSTYVTGDMASAGLHFEFPTATWSGTSFAAPRVTGAIAAAMTGNGRLSARDALKNVLAAETEEAPEFFGKFVP